MPFNNWEYDLWKKKTSKHKQFYLAMGPNNVTNFKEKPTLKTENTK